MDVGLAKRWQGAWEVCVFDRGVVEICERIGMVDITIERSRFAGMADSVLTGYHASVCEPSGYVMREVADDSGQHSGFRFVDATHDCKKVNCGLEGAGE